MLYRNNEICDTVRGVFGNQFYTCSTNMYSMDLAFVEILCII